MVVEGSRIRPGHELIGYAPGYVDAMHGLCVTCHTGLSRDNPDEYGPHFDRCDVCHREFEDRDHRRMAPYVPMPPGHTDTELWPRSGVAAANATGNAAQSAPDGP